MIIYRCIFDIIIGPFIGMGDDDELVFAVMEYEKRQDFQGLCGFVEKTTIEDLEKSSKNYLSSKNIQATLFYYLKCLDRKQLIYNLERDLIGFENFDCFFIPLEKIYNQISKNIGFLEMECSDFVENDGHFHDIFKTQEEIIEYLNS